MPMPSMACAVCGLVLHHRTVFFDVGSTQTWFHSAVADHLTVAVPVQDISTNFQCDFCMSAHARWTLPVEQYVVAPGSVNDGDWAACDSCAELLLGNDWDALTTRAHQHFVANDPDMPLAPRVAFEGIYRQLRPHVIGAIHLRLEPS